MLRGAALVAGLDLRRRLRNRSLLVQSIVGPVVLATIISGAFAGTADGLDVTVAVVAADRSPAGQAFADGLLDADDGGLRFERATSEAVAGASVDDGDVAAAIVVPDGFGDSLAGATPLALRVVTDDEQRIGGAIATAVAEGVAARVNTGRLAVGTALAAGGEDAAGRLDELVAAARSVDLPATVADAGFDADFHPASYFGPSMAILFLFFTVGFGARSLLVEQREGTLARLRSSPVPFAAVLLGKAVSVAVAGLVSLLVVWAVTGLVLGADWGDPVAVGVLVVAVVLAVAGIGSLVTGVARTDAQADAWTSMVTFAFALLGGNFLTPGAMPELLRRVSLLTPNGWALRGFTELSAGGGGLGDIAPAVGVLLAIAAVTGVVGVGLLSRRLA